MKARSFARNMLRLVPSSGGISRGFTSFLEVATAMNASDRDESFREMVIRFDKPARYLFMETYSYLVLEMTGDGSGLTDVLGEFYFKYIETGQKIAGQTYCDMIPGIIRADIRNFSVADYRCRTGRRLLAAAKYNRNFRFFGADPDITMCRITLLNLCLNGLFGEVARYDAGHDRFYSAWNIDLDTYGKHAIFILPDEKSLIFQKRSTNLPDTSKLIFNY